MAESTILLCIVLLLAMSEACSYILSWPADVCNYPSYLDGATKYYSEMYTCIDDIPYLQS